MKPVDQTKFGPVEGNCFSAAVASILEISIDEVPWFMTNPGQWFEQFSAWCASRGATAKYWPCKAWCEEWDGTGEPRVFIGVPVGHAIMSGESPRYPGKLHSVVAMNGETVHDPHPSRAGVLGGIDYRDFVTIDGGSP